MKNKLQNYREPVLGVIILAALITIFTTKDVSMSDEVSFMLLTFFAIGVISYGVYVWQENPADEREKELLMIASKHAYLAGSFVVGLGIIVQSLNHELDSWLVAAFGATVLVKLISYFIHRREQE